MKKITIIIMATLLPTMTFAQLKVNSSGKTSLGTDNFPYRLTVVGTNTDEYAAKISGVTGNALTIENNRTTSGSTGKGLNVNTTVNTSYTAYGIYSLAKNTNTASSSAKAVGVNGIANTISNTIGYGVIGTLTGTSSCNGAGVYGGTSISISSPSGRYAGYFQGNVKVTGTIDGTLVNSSDARLKENIQSLEEDFRRGGNALSSLDLLTPISFNYKDTTANSSNKNGILLEDPETGELVESEIEEVPNPVMLKKHFGFVAQELQKVYPDLVYEQDNGYLAVNYTELIPVLVQAIKELNAKVEELSGNTSARKTMTTETTDIDSNSLPFGEGMGVGSMSQNVPNPFTEKTDIAIYLPESVQTATLYIYDLSGKQLEQHPVTGRGNTVMTIHADKMDAGMYVYSLVADKKVITTKKMIVTK